jgi:hypothetical protein
MLPSVQPAAISTPYDLAWTQSLSTSFVCGIRPVRQGAAPHETIV